MKRTSFLLALLLARPSARPAASAGRHAACTPRLARLLPACTVLPPAPAAR